MGQSRAGGMVAVLLLIVSLAGAATRPTVSAATDDATLARSAGRQRAVFAGGCFWGTQSVFERVRGVVGTTTGYAGGSAATATYAQVRTETTEHAEAVEVLYDPSRITYGQLLRIFFSVVHDPTQRNRQGPDVGRSYRSAIFFTSSEQQRIATSYVAQLTAAKVFAAPIVTEVTPLKGFFRAESYHQDYALRHPNDRYIQVCDRPKIEALQREFPELFVESQGRQEAARR